VLLATHLIDEAADRFFTTPTVGGLTGLLAAAAVALLAGGYGTVRCLTV
jgi:hypothetical protein